MYKFNVKHEIFEFFDFFMFKYSGRQKHKSLMNIKIKFIMVT